MKPTLLLFLALTGASLSAHAALPEPTFSIAQEDDCNSGLHRQPPPLNPLTAKKWGLTVAEKITTRDWSLELSGALSPYGPVHNEGYEIYSDLRELGHLLLISESETAHATINARMVSLRDRPGYADGILQFAKHYWYEQARLFQGNADQAAANLRDAREHPEKFTEELAYLPDLILRDIRALTATLLPTVSDLQNNLLHFTFRYTADLKQLGAAGFAKLLRAGYFQTAQELLDLELPRVRADMRRLSEGDRRSLDENWAAPETGGIISTPLENLTRFSAFFGFKPGQKLIDIGSGHGNPGIALGALNPELEVTGYDLVQAKVDGANRLATALGLDKVQFLQQDLSRKDFELPAADYYYFFNPANPKVVRLMVKQIKKHAKAGVPVQVIILSGGWVPGILEEQGFQPLTPESRWAFRVYHYVGKR